MQQPNRSAMFVAELRLYIDFLKKEIERALSPSARDFKSWEKYSENLLEGIEHYRDLASNYFLKKKHQFEQDLEEAKMEILQIQESQLQIG